MKKQWSVVLILVLILSGLPYRPAIARPSHAAETDRDLPGFRRTAGSHNLAGLQGLAYPAAPDRIIVKFRPGVQPTRGALRAGQAALDRLLASSDVRAARPLQTSEVFRNLGGLGLERIYRLDLAPAADSAALIAALAADPSVEYAEPDYLARAAAPSPQGRGVGVRATIPNDPLFSQQWGLAQINAPAAWDVVTGTQTVVIAIVDSGLDLTHPDLSSRLWINPGEIAANGLDDDNNGYLDDVRGWNFVNGSNDVADGNGHGTQVAGVAAAAANNGVGVAGVCWNCRLMPVKVMADSGISNYSDIALGVIYAADKGAHVINLSLGGYAYSNALRDAVDYAVGKGAVVVGGAGNDNVATSFYPAAYESVVAVAATDAGDLKVNFSNYGTWVDLSAPGAAITTTFLGGDWGPADGTSLSAPFVSGLAALVRSRWPDWTPALVRNQLAQTADDIDALNPAYAGKLGAGRIDAAAAMQAPHPVLTLDGTSVNGDPLGRPTPGVGATLAVALHNAWADAAGVSGVLSTADPHVTLASDAASYGDISAGASGVSNPVYSFTVASGAGYNHPIPFTLFVTANAGAYTATIPLTVTTRSGDEHFCGTVADDMLWTNDKTYILDCNVGIAPGYTLTIQAGTVVRFNGDYSLNVGGALVADGTSAQPIRFMPHAGGSWGRIFFDDPSVDARATLSGTYQSGNLLRHVRIEGAAQGIGCASATPYLDHVTLTGGGMSCAGGDTALWVQDSALSEDMQIGAGSGVGGPLGTWTDRAPMPTARWGLGIAAASNGRIYAIGGYNGDSRLATVEEYDPATDTWTARAPMPTARELLVAATAPNGRIYAIGGYYGGPCLATVEEYDPATDTWTTRAPMPTARNALAAATAPNGKLYAIGGYSGGYLATVEEYDPATDTWTARASMPTARSGLAVAAAPNGRLHAIGGYNNDHGYLTTVEVYDPATDTWMTRAPMPTARGYLGVAAAPNGRLYAIGGEEGGALATVEEYDPATDAWTARASMPTARQFLATAAASNGRLYAIGGYNGGALATVEEFTPPTEEYGYHILRTTLHGGLSLPDISQVLTSAIGGSITAGSASVIQNTTASGGITINGGGTVANSTANGAISLGSGTVQNTTVNGGSVSMGSGSVLSNTIRGGGISAGNGSTVRANSVENAPNWAISGSAATVAENRLVGNADGIQASGGVVEYNLIANTAGVGLELAGSATAEHNTFTGVGGSAVKITAGTAVTLTGNNFEFNTGAYDVEDLVSKTVLPTVDARHNWWGTTSGAAIRGRIWDFSDDYTLGAVLYSPVLTQPSALAPAYVRAVTLTPESPVGIQTVAFDVLFSRAMESTVLPALSFRSTCNPWTVYNSSNSGLPNDTVYAIAADADGSLWFGTDAGGVAHFDGAIWTAYNTANSGLPSNNVGDIMVDADGSHWFGTNGGGVAHFDGEIWTIYNTSNSGLPGDNVWSIAADADGSHWFGTWGGGVAHFDGMTWTIYNTSNSGLPGDIVRVAVDTDGTHWFSTRYNGVAYFDGAIWTVYNTANSGLPHNEVNTLAIDADGSRWFGTFGGGAAHFDDATWTIYDTGNSGLPNNALYTIAMDVDGSYWFGTQGGVAHFNSATWTVYNTTNSGLPNDYVLDIAIDTDGSYWFGTYGGVGVLRNFQTRSVQYNPRWVDAAHYRATYDFSTLVPRGSYTITLSGAQTPETTGSGTLLLPVPGGGMEIAPNSAYTFTVDYAGYINDTTAPPAPAVTACAAATPDTLSAVWSAYDPESAIDRYQYAIGVAPGGAEVVNWTFTTLTATTRISLTLVAGQTYYVSVKARNEGGIWSEAGSVGVVAGSGTCAGTEPASPQVDFSAAPRSGDAPLEVHFTSVVTGAVTSYAWAFGDGGTATTLHPTYTYQNAGSFGVTLVVTGPGGTASESKPGYITVNPPPGAPTAAFSADVVSGTAPLAVAFTAVTSGVVEHWHWDFGDGAQALTGPVVQHTYTTSGTFDVSLTVSNTHGSYTQNRPGYITVVEPPPPAPEVDFSAAPRSGDAPLEVHFTSVVTGAVTSYAWAFGDGGVATIAHPTHTYASAGSFGVTLVITGPGGTAQAAKPGYITVNAPPGAPTATFSADVVSGVAPLTVTFTAVASGTVEGWRWNFGDGAEAFTGPIVQHTYTTSGTFDVSLTVSNTHGSFTDSKPGYITVSEPPLPAPQVDFSATPRSGDAPLEVHFTSIVTGAVTGYAWAFGDGRTAATPHPTHTYTSAGSFGVTLVVTGPGGAAQAVKPGYITVNAPPGAPTATFTADVVSGVAPLTVTFTAVTSGTVEHWRWTFGDGAEAFTGPIVQHTYTASGTFDVSLTVSNTHGSYTRNRPGYITVVELVAEPVADFTASPLAGHPPLTVVFTDTSTGSVNAWLWQFGDGGMSAQQRPTHTYTLTGTFTVSLTVSGPGGSDTEVKAGYIRVSESAVIANFTAAPTEGDAPLAVHFTDQSVGDITSWQWDFGDEDTLTGTARLPVHVYEAAGVYTVSLRASGPGGSDVLARPGHITVTGGRRVYLPLVLRAQ